MLNTKATNLNAASIHGNLVINNSLATAAALTSASTGTGTVNIHQSGGGTLTAPTVSGSGAVSLTLADSNGLLSNSGSVSGSTVTLIADRMAILGGTVAASGSVTLAPFSAAEPVVLGPTSDPSGSLSLSGRGVEDGERRQCERGLPCACSCRPRGHRGRSAFPTGDIQGSRVGADVLRSPG